MPALVRGQTLWKWGNQMGTRLLRNVWACNMDRVHSAFAEAVPCAGSTPDCAGDVDSAERAPAAALTMSVSTFRQRSCVLTRVSCHFVGTSSA